ncbi:SDR family NAD(P)-dependent oxidoreductase [Sphingomonas bacterium]|uniref:SDR family NAD(P)-dependent oxidoreductase n=1 Tax=Sphingomonas bacterium TaxID=1895847 RepID=UPI001C2D6E12|nr:SDR family oxidoreductase [Sphingomonas bacterium]
MTGASRGIGKAVAVRLAQAGFDVAITARTLNEGEKREHSSSTTTSDCSPLPGSLNTTAEIIRSFGRDAIVLPADLLDRASLGAAAATVLERWSRIDLVVHNARFIGPGHMDRLLDTPIEVLERHVQGNAIAPLVLNRYFLPAMIAQGGGTFVNLTSAAALGPPPKPIGQGGWGLSYSLSKAALHSIAAFIALEHGADNVRCFNLQPGFIATERIAQDMRQFGFSATSGAPPEVVAEVVLWLATSPEAVALNGGNIQAQPFCHERGLLPGWGGPGAAT